MKKYNKNTFSIFLWLLPTIMLFLALLPLPYGYYILLRVVVCTISGVICFVEYRKNGIDIWSIIFGIFTLLYNPFFPMHLGRVIWTPVNVITALGFILYSKKTKITETS